MTVFLKVWQHPHILWAGVRLSEPPFRQVRRISTSASIRLPHTILIPLPKSLQGPGWLWCCCLDHLSVFPHVSQKLALVFTEAPHEEQDFVSEFPRADDAEDGSGGAVAFCLRFNRTTLMSPITTTAAMSKAHGKKEF